MSYSMSPFPLRFGSRQGGGGFSPDFWLDSSVESDGDGSQASPFKLPASAISAVNSHGNGAKLGVATDSLFRTSNFTFTSTLTGIEVRGVGSGAKPIFAGDRLILGTWTVDPTHSEVWYQDVTHETATVPLGASHSNTCHFGMWFDDTEAAPILANATIADNRAAVAALPGSFTCHLDGSTVADPRTTGQGGTVFRYYIHLPDSSNPNEYAGDISYAEQAQIATLGSAGIWDGLEFRRTAIKDMTGGSTGGGALSFQGAIRNCIFRDAAVHGVVARPALVSGCNMYLREQMSTRYGGGLVLFYGSSEGNLLPPTVIANSVADGFLYGFYSHGTGYPTVLEALTIRGCRAENCFEALSIPGVDSLVEIDDFESINCDGIGSIYSEWQATNLTHLSPETGNVVALPLAADGTLINSSIVSRSSGTNTLATNEYAQSEDSADVFTLTLNNVSVVGCDDTINTARRAQIDLVANDSILSKLSRDQAVDRYFASFVGDNSYVSIQDNTVAEMELLFDFTQTDCLSPYEMASIERTVESGDLTLTGSNTVSGTASSAAVTSSSTASQFNGQGRLIQDIDGAGATLGVYIESGAGTTSHTLHKVMPNTFSTKPYKLTQYRQTFDFESPLRPSPNSSKESKGPTVTWEFETYSLSKSQQWNLLHRFRDIQPNQRASDLEFTSGSVLGVDTDSGVIDYAFLVVAGTTLTVSAALDRAAEYEIWQGDPLTTGIAIIDPASPLYALGMGRQTA